MRRWNGQQVIISNSSSMTSTGSWKKWPVQEIQITKDAKSSYLKRFYSKMGKLTKS